VYVVTVASLSPSSDVAGAPTASADLQRAQQIAANIREHVPTGGTFKEFTLAASLYLTHHSAELTGRATADEMNFNDYLCLQWAGFLLAAPPGKSYLTKQEFLNRFLGRPNEPNSGWNIRGDEVLPLALYNKIDKTKRGYITIEEYRPEAVREFRSQHLRR
jgi:hypothetical protein